jgi:hypothetical protein
MPIGRRIHDDTVISTFPPDLSRDEGTDVIDEPADGGVIEPVQAGVPSCPLDRWLRGIDMCHGSARMGQGDRQETGVREEVEHGRPIAETRDAIAQPRQERRLFREEPDLAGVGRPGLEREPLKLEGPVPPRVDDTRAGPAGGSIEPQVRISPSIRRASSVLHSPMGTVDQEPSEPFQPTSIAGIDQLIARHERIFTGNRPYGGVESDRRETRRLT